MHGKQNQWLQTLNFPRQATFSKQIIQFEGSSACLVSPPVVSVLFRPFPKRDMALLFTNFSFQNGAVLSRAKWLASSEINYAFSLVNILAQFSANHNCHTKRMQGPGTRHSCWYYPLTRVIAVIRRKLFIENMADIGGMIATTGIESPNKRAKMDSGLTATNFDESKFARYYRTDAARSPTSSHSAPVVSDTSAYYSYPYTYTNSFSSYSYPCGQTDATALYTYPASYGVHYSPMNGFSTEYAAVSGTSFRFLLAFTLISLNALLEKS